MRTTSTSLFGLLVCLAPLSAQDTNYYTVAEIEAALAADAATNPSIAQRVNISALSGGMVTHDGRSIYALKISDNVASDEDEPAILIAAQHHARELNSPVIVLGGIDRILSGYATDPAIQALVDGHELWFVPMVNPDGVAHVWNTYNYWRKNRRDNPGSSEGVDLNRNYPFLWGMCGTSTSYSSEIYRGPAPASEPETQTMRNLAAFIRPEIYLDYHSYGREVLRTYAPCATVHSTIDNLLEHYVDDLRAPMSYAKRDPSASGEAPEDHWSNGTLSFLTEVSTSFQPAYSSAVTEEARVWPGMRQAMTSWRPAVRGHVRSSLGNAPLAAEVTYTPSVFYHGEKCLSRARDGRYGLWLPIGTWNVTFTAPGHQSASVPVTVTAYDTPTIIEVVLDPAGASAILSKTGAGNIGTSVDFTYTSPGDAGEIAFFGWSLGTSPGINVGGTRTIPLNPDFLMSAAVSGNAYLSPTWTILDSQSQAQSALQIPNLPWLIGYQTWFAGITFDWSYVAGVKTWSNPISVTPIL